MNIKEEKLELIHGKEIKPLLKSINSALSEYCFPNLYLFREKHDYKILTVNNFKYLSGMSYNNEKYLMPLENIDTTSSEYLKTLKELLADYDCIFPIPEKWLKHFPESEFRNDFLEDDSEYIYKNEKLALYPGRKLSKKRNLVKQFLSANEPHLKLINNCSKPHIIELLELWQSRSEQEMGSSDYNSCIKALEHFEELGLSGALFLSENEPVGFIIGEAAGESSFVIHFAKGDTNKKGIYQYMFQSYVSEYCKDYEIINLEQDMGMEGLRKTKRSYQPDHMLLKYRIYRKS